MDRMKNIFLTATLFIFCISFNLEVECAKISTNAKHIGVVIVGNSDFTTNDCYSLARNNLNPNKNKNIIIESGDDVQSKYIYYWASKGFLEEQELTEKDMIDFANMSGYDNVIYLIPIDFSSESSLQHSKTFMEHFFFGGAIERKNLSLEFAGVFCDKNEIIKKYNSIGGGVVLTKNNMDTTGKLENKHEVFAECIRGFGKELNL